MSVYNDRFTAHIWNNIRSSRIFLHQAVLQLHHPVLLQSSPYTTTTRSLYNPTALHYPSIEASRALITELAAEIIATIPQLAGILSHVERAHKMASHSPGASEEGQHVSLACHVQEQIRTSTNQHFTELPQITASNCASTIEYTQLFVYDAGSFKRSRGPRMKKRKATASTRTANSTAAMSDPVPLPPSMFHILFQLYGLSTIRILPGRMKTWIIECIRWLEKHSAIEDFVRVQKMARQYFGDGNYVTFED